MLPRYENTEQEFYSTIRTWRGEATVLQTSQTRRDMAGEPQAGGRLLGGGERAVFDPIMTNINKHG